MTDFRWVYVTASCLAEAQKMAQEVLEDRLAACANIQSPIQSYYWWEGKIESATETVIVLKSHRSKIEALIQKIKTIHSYSCPCIVTLPILEGHPDYLKWLSMELGIYE